MTQEPELLLEALHVLGEEFDQSQPAPLDEDARLRAASEADVAIPTSARSSLAALPIQAPMAFVHPTFEHTTNASQMP